MEHPAVDALRELTDPRNWSGTAGRVEWIGRPDAIIRAKAVLTQLTLICIKCKSPLPYDSYCPDGECPHALGQVKTMKSRR